MFFSELHLIEPLLRAVESEGYEHPTPIQQKAIPHLLEGKDLVGIARTGTGKTAAFALPLLQRMHTIPHKAPGAGTRPVRLLVLTPTRELASQVAESFGTYGKNLHLSNTVIFGGVGQEPQVRALRSGVDILVATPGRLLDLLQQKLCKLDRVEYFVLDEADRMLDMGFIHDVRRIISHLPPAGTRQTLLFSATMPEEIRQLSQTILRDPVRVEAAPVASTAEKIEQSVWMVPKGEKRRLLEKLLADPAIQRALVFTRTKHGANRVAEALDKVGIHAAAIHGNKSQGARERALGGFKSGELRVLVATDIAARGIDIDGITHVFQFDLPEVPEQYVHRIGRTARAGASGIAVAFCDREERPLLADIEKLTRQKIPVAGEIASSGGDRGIDEDRPPLPAGGGRRGGGRGGDRSSPSPRAEGAPARAPGGGEREGGRRRGGRGPGAGGAPRGPSNGPGGGSRGPRSGGGGPGGGGGGGGGNRSRRGPSIDQVLNFLKR